MLSFALVDPAFLIEHGHARGMRVRFFRPSREALPVVNIGDMVVLREIKVVLVLENETLRKLTINSGWTLPTVRI